MNWNDLPGSVLDTMKFLGHFSPTSAPEQKFVKGYMHDEDVGGKCYLDSNDLREMAEHFIVVADWLDKRAEAA